MGGKREGLCLGKQKEIKISFKIEQEEIRVCEEKNRKKRRYRYFKSVQEETKWACVGK